MEINDKFNSKGLVNFNANNGDEKWEWRKEGHSIEAVNSDKYNNIDMSILMGAEILSLVGLVASIGTMTVIFPHTSVILSLLLFAICFVGIPGFIMRGVTSKENQIRNFLTHKVFHNVILDRVEFSEKVSKNSINNIAGVLNVFKKYNRNAEYDSVLHDARNLSRAELNKKYANINVNAIENKINVDNEKISAKNGAKSLEAITNNIVESHVIIERNNNDLIKDFVSKDACLNIMYNLEKVVDQMSVSDKNDYTKCFDTLVKCNKIINDSLDYLNVEADGEDLSKFNEIADITIPVFNRIMANINATRKSKLDAAAIYLKDSLGVNGSVKEITGTMDYHSVDRFLKDDVQEFQHVNFYGKGE